MKNEKKLNIAIIGLGFGAEFIPIYQKHPNTNLKVICDANKENLDEVGNLFKVDNRTDSYDEVLKDPDIDVIHLVTPIIFLKGGVEAVQFIRAKNSLPFAFFELQIPRIGGWGIFRNYTVINGQLKNLVDNAAKD